MAVSMDKIKELRDRTSVGISDCKKALEESAGDMDKAIEWLQKKGISKAQARGKEAKEGLVHAYVHPGGRIGVLVEVNCNTDFVARTKEFQEFADDVAMQIAAMRPMWVSREAVPPAALEKQREIFAEQVKETAKNKPENIVAKIVDGKVTKWYSDVCLLDQAFVKDDSKTIDQVRGALITKTGENVVVGRFTRYELGEKE